MTDFQTLLSQSVLFQDDNFAALVDGVGHIYSFLGWLFLVSGTFCSRQSHLLISGSDGSKLAISNYLLDIIYVFSILSSCFDTFFFPNQKNPYIKG